ncbi:hypothetical protein ACQ4PT_037230 [Festuca glaucescens]
MEGVEGMMKGLRLSEAERKGIKIRWRGGGKVGVVEVQAIVKLMSEKPAIAEAMEAALGPIWCPMKGIECKHMGDNTFFITFNQALGKNKAVDGGPWKFDNSLLVVEDFQASKNLDEYDFNKIPIWVRIFKLPLGMMSRETGEIIGEEIGEWMEVDGVENGLAMGKYLRVKVRMSITKPIMRGTMVDVDESGRTRWCPFQYEFLPDFCYVCGIIGHLDRECTIKLKKGEEPQFGRWLRWLPPKKFTSVDTRRGWNDGGGRRTVGWSSGGSKSGSLGSDGPSWRKDINYTRDNPLKPTEGSGKNEETMAKQTDMDIIEKEAEGGKGAGDVASEKKGGAGTEVMVIDKNKNNSSKGNLELSNVKGGERGVAENHFGGREEGGGKKQEGKRPGSKTFRRKERKDTNGVSREMVLFGQKRGGDDMDLDELNKAKKPKEGLHVVQQQEINSNKNEKAGLSEQLREQK